MGQLEYKMSYRRNLPHIQPPGATMFVTYRLFGSIPDDICQKLITEAERIDCELDQIKDYKKRIQQGYLEQERMFAKWDNFLNVATIDPYWLADERIAKIVTDSLHYLHGRLCDLQAYCVMSNHVHVLFTPLLKDKQITKYYPLSKIMHDHKRHTARQANKILEREGQFWEHESYDHFVRDDRELQRILIYILNNPVKAGLVEQWSDWKWTYCRTSL